MAKQSGIDKVIKELEADIEAHQREINAKLMLIARLQGHLPAKRTKPRAVKVMAEKTA